MPDKQTETAVIARYEQGLLTLREAALQLWSIEERRFGSVEAVEAYIEAKLSRR